MVGEEVKLVRMIYSYFKLCSIFYNSSIVDKLIRNKDKYEEVEDFIINPLKELSNLFKDISSKKEIDESVRIYLIEKRNTEYLKILTNYIWYGLNQRSSIYNYIPRENIFVDKQLLIPFRDFFNIDIQSQLSIFDLGDISGQVEIILDEQRILWQ